MKKRIADFIKGSSLQNPFSDSQARNFSDTKLINEFCPISNYWSLFNDQHEILLGTRGSGKTFLLKMMRYSMLKRIETPQAQQLAEKKEYIALYVPMYLEFVTHLTSADTSEEKQIQLFQFAFNCLLAQSLLVELKEILSEEKDKVKWAKTNMDLALALNDSWFDDHTQNVTDLFSLMNRLRKLFYNFDVTTGDMSTIPPVFKRQIGASLLAVKELVAEHLRLREEPTWIVCIDEAEFLSEPLQRCINSVFRSDSRRIALKVATLPYYHRTLQTLDPDVSVSSGNDFSYRVVDMKYDDVDFYNLTNTLVSNRIKTRFDSSLQIAKLEDFLGVCGEDAQIDYYREEVGSKSATYDAILEDIIAELSDERKKSVDNYCNLRKTIYDKFAPIFYVRCMYQLSRKGNTKPGWYAGSQMVRKIAQGNPRAFIQIMNKLFEKARVSELKPKVQHGVIMDYVQAFCESTQALESNGPTIYQELHIIASKLHDHVHDHEIRSTGCNFILSFDSNQSFEYARKWLQQAIAYSRVTVDEDTLINGISKTTVFLLANTYAAKYWLPMRADVSPKNIVIRNQQVGTYIVKMPGKKEPQIEQLSLFEEES
mgnify:FL=1